MSGCAVEVISAEFGEEGFHRGGHRRGLIVVVAPLATLGPDASTVFTPLDEEPALLDDGILAAPMAELDRRWRASIEPTLATLGLPMPPPASDPARGRLDHGEPFNWLWGEFNTVRRSEPGVTW